MRKILFDINPIIIVVAGKVQGVGFRYSAKQAALEHNIKGFVKNLDDGKVYIEAEGTQENMDAYIIWCKSGPRWAIVSDISITKGEVKHFTSFDIRS